MLPRTTPAPRKEPAPPSFYLSACPPPPLPGRQRKRRDPPHHAPKQPPCQTALRHQEPAVASTGPNMLPVAVLPTLVSAPARLSRNRPRAPDAGVAAARHRPPGVKSKTATTGTPATAPPSPCPPGGPLVERPWTALGRARRRLGTGGRPETGRPPQNPLAEFWQRNPRCSGRWR